MNPAVGVKVTDPAAVSTVQSPWPVTCSAVTPVPSASTRAEGGGVEVARVVADHVHGDGLPGSLTAASSVVATGRGFTAFAKEQSTDATPGGIVNVPVVPSPCTIGAPVAGSVQVQVVV